MAQSSKKSAHRRKPSRGSSRRSRSRSMDGKGTDAIALLKADHREVKGWFGDFEKSSGARKQQLAQKICMALKAHTTIEEEIFYPAFLEATDEKHIHHEAEVEHEGATRLIEEIEAAGPDDDYFDARMSVLAEMVKHHIKEEERRGGMLAKARDSDMDLGALGAKLEQRKAEVMTAERTSASSRRGRAKVPAAMLGRNSRGRAGTQNSLSARRLICMVRLPSFP